MYAARLTHGPVALAFTDRHGGVSAAPFDSLNLAWAGGDDARRDGREPTAACWPTSPRAPRSRPGLLSQVHGDDVAVVGPDGPAPTSTATCTPSATPWSPTQPGRRR